MTGSRVPVLSLVHAFAIVLRTMQQRLLLAHTAPRTRTYWSVPIAPAAPSRSGNKPWQLQSHVWRAAPRLWRSACFASLCCVCSLVRYDGVKPLLPFESARCFGAGTSWSRRNSFSVGPIRPCGRACLFFCAHVQTCMYVRPPRSPNTANRGATEGVSHTRRADVERAARAARTASTLSTVTNVRLPLDAPAHGTQTSASHMAAAVCHARDKAEPA